MLTHIKSFLRCAFRFKKISLLLLIVLGGTAIALWMKKHPTAISPDRIKKVEVKKATFQTIQQSVQFIGVLKSSQSTVLFAKSKGIVHQVAVSGARLKKGEIIAVIDDADTVRRYQLAQQSETLAKIQYRRAQTLLQSGVYSKNMVEDKKLAWIDAEKRLSDAKSIYDDLTIKAPFAGILGVFKVKEGSLMQVSQSLVTVYNPDQMAVEFDVPLSTASKIDAGSEVVVRKKSYKLTYIQKMLDEETHMCPAYVNIVCSDCITGEALDVEVVVAKKEHVIVIPFEAIFLRQGKFAVYAVEKGKAQLKRIETGLRDKERIEVSNGLSEGDEVVVRGQSRLYPNAPVRVN